jgi:hypothetical protein
MIGVPFAIHAGLARDRGVFMPRGESPPLFLDQGAVVAVATLKGYVHVDKPLHRIFFTDSQGMLTMTDMQNVIRSMWAIGPICWSLTDVVALPHPVPCKGHQGLWELPPDVLEEVLAQVAEVNAEK